MTHWSKEAVFYHIYPLGLCGAPEHNDFQSAPVNRLEKLIEWAGHISDLGANALYLGPVFESGSHGYDTADFYQVDRRLGTNQDLAEVVREFKEKGIRVLFDGVFNHVGRHFWAFRDVQQNLSASPFCGWFKNLRFGQNNACNDPFTYDTWEGHCLLAKLDLQHPDVKNHLLAAIAEWIREYDIDGLRLDASDCLDLEFLKELAGYCRAIKPDFWLVGEIIHGDYRRWANPDGIDSVTNYECYKGLYSTLNDRNIFEIAYSLNRQYGAGGLYRQLDLYNFADNHDVSRVAGILNNPCHLYLLYIMLFTIPGIPSIYYGSEWGWEGKKVPGTDKSLRPAIDLKTAAQHAPHPDLINTIGRLIDIRKQSRALIAGNYRQLLVASEQFGYMRTVNEEKIIVLINLEDRPVRAGLKVPEMENLVFEDRLNPGYSCTIKSGTTGLELDPCWGRILQWKQTG